jgi:hypothetical protein
MHHVQGFWAKVLMMYPRGIYHKMVLLEQINELYMADLFAL